MSLRLIYILFFFLLSSYTHAQPGVIVVRKPKQPFEIKSDPRHLEPVKCGTISDPNQPHFICRLGLQQFKSTLIEAGLRGETASTTQAIDLKLEFNPLNNVYGISAVAQRRLNGSRSRKHIILFGGAGATVYASDAGASLWAYPTLSLRPSRWLAGILELSYGYAFCIFKDEDLSKDVSSINPNHRITLSLNLLSF